MENILNKKLHLIPGLSIAIINAPDGYLKSLNPLPKDTVLKTKFAGKCNFIQYFVKNISELEKAIPLCKQAIKREGTIWITYPKQSSDIKSDLTRDKSFPIMQKFGFRGVAMISIDETWTAFRIKPVSDIAEPGKTKTNNYSDYIDANKRIITPPEDFQEELDKNKKALEFFNTLSFTNKKEYVVWILDSKKEETRNKRLHATIEKLLKGAKNPSQNA